MSSKNRDKTEISRRDFLGLASLWAAVLPAIAFLGGMFRMVKPNVRYEESTRFKIGTVENFPVGITKKLEDKKVFIFSTDEGLHAISSICTHLGCIVNITEWGFQCPCHGSRYNQNGKVIAGPAPRNLSWHEISQDIDGSLVIDAAKDVPPGTIFKLKA
ncbi:MAG: ubiquinol-cytochrome c reductase iron-sulfur subunit [Nitrospirota bacterium]|jgi:Rieske Fe-S protein